MIKNNIMIMIIIIINNNNKNKESLDNIGNYIINNRNQNKSLILTILTLSNFKKPNTKNKRNIFNLATSHI